MQLKTITLWEQNWDTHTERPDNLEAYILWLTAKLNEVPEEYRPLARVEIEAEPSYEGSAVLKYLLVYVACGLGVIAYISASIIRGTYRGADGARMLGVLCFLSAALITYVFIFRP